MTGMVIRRVKKLIAWALAFVVVLLMASGAWYLVAAV
jgi:hypothetical protein